MSDLNDQGVSNGEMPDWFNATGLPTPGGTHYIPNLYGVAYISLNEDKKESETPIGKKEKL
ncbi:MAG: hypothetical protein VXX78_04555 [Pseudomonadota bacterium]|nr:hypothetical protein [Pseudomonadota bacterium]